MIDFSSSELAQRLRAAGEPPLILDVREPWEYDIAHLDDSLLIPMREVPARLGELDAAREIVVVCHHGVRSRAVARLLEQHGFARIVNLQGGLDAWAREVDRDMPVYA